MARISWGKYENMDTVLPLKAAFISIYNSFNFITSKWALNKSLALPAVDLVLLLCSTYLTLIGNSL